MKGRQNSVRSKNYPAIRMQDFSASNQQPRWSNMLTKESMHPTKEEGRLVGERVLRHGAMLQTCLMSALVSRTHSKEFTHCRALLFFYPSPIIHLLLYSELCFLVRFLQDDASAVSDAEARNCSNFTRMVVNSNLLHSLIPKSMNQALHHFLPVHQRGQLQNFPSQVKG